jgi:hypothetical protein
MPDLPALRFLDFEASDDGEGHLTLDAMASVRPEQRAALMGEVERVLAWARAEFPEGPAPLDEGGDWDLDLQASTERSTRERLHLDAATGRLVSAPAGGEAVRHTLTLSIAATEAFGAAFRDAFGPEGDG